MPTLIKMERIIGEYRIFVEGDEENAIAKVETDSGAVILDSAYKAVEGVILGYEYVMDAMEVAEYAAVEAYHQALGTTNGSVGINSLITHPFNELIYGEEEVEDLVNLLSKEDGQIFEVSINSKGQILSGNRRIKAGVEVNKRAIASGNPPKFETVTVKVLNFDSPESELKFMILQNQGRNKTKKQRLEESKALIALESVAATPADTLISSQDLIAQLRENLGDASRATAFNAKKALKKAQKVKDPELREKLENFIFEVPNKGKDLMEARVPDSAGIDKEEYQAKLLSHLEANPSHSVISAIAQINAAIIPKEESDILKRMREKGDVPNDNRKTPKEYVELATLALGGRIDVDAFAMASDPDWIPAQQRFTIFDDAFMQEIEGNVFANPPFSNASEAIALMDRNIGCGNIKKLFLILPSGVLSTKAFHEIMKRHNPCLFLPNKRLAFEPGELLLAEKSNASTNSNREPSAIIFFSTDSEDYSEFLSLTDGKGWCGRQYASEAANAAPVKTRKKKSAA